MIIEYKIKFEDDTVTITQSLTEDLPAKGKGVGAVTPEPGAVAAGPPDHDAVIPEPGGFRRPIVLLGPMVIGNPCPNGPTIPHAKITGVDGINRNNVNHPRFSAAFLNPSGTNAALPFTMLSQEQTNWCWAATATSIRKYFSPTTAVTQCDIANEVFTRTDCCDSPCPCNQTRTVPDALGTICQQTIPGQVTFDVIQEQIERLQVPVCVRIAWDIDHDGFEDGGHVVTITGWSVVDGVQYVMVHDPDGGRNDGSSAQATLRKVPYETFQTAYRGCGIWDETYLVKEG